MENDVKEDLEQARPKQELEKQKQELEKQKLEQEKQKLEQEKQESESKEEEKIKKQKRFSFISKFWGGRIGYFLGGLFALVIVYIFLKIIAFYGSSEEAKTHKPKKLFNYAEKFLPTDILKYNIDSHQAEINAALNSGIKEMNGVINTQIDGFLIW